MGHYSFGGDSHFWEGFDSRSPSLRFVVTWEGPITYNLFRRLAVERAEPLCGLGSSPPVDFADPLFARSHGRWGYAAMLPDIF